VSESSWSATVAALITGGVGATVGGVLTAIVQSVSHKNESRAAAADLVTNAAGNLADRLDKLNTRLERQLTEVEREKLQMRKAMVALTEAVEELLPMVTDEATRRRVQKAISAARVAFR
jgi:predicted metal-dependent hydrolase